MCNFNKEAFDNNITTIKIILVSNPYLKILTVKQFKVFLK